MLSDQERPRDSSYSSPSLPGGLASELQQSQTSIGQQGTGTLMPANRNGSATFMSEGRASKSSMPRVSSRKKDKQLVSQQVHNCIPSSLSVTGHVQRRVCVCVLRMR